jgi:hypothetical protein
MSIGYAGNIAPYLAFVAMVEEAIRCWLQAIRFRLQAAGYPLLAAGLQQVTCKITIYNLPFTINNLCLTIPTLLKSAILMPTCATRALDFR